ncbi:ATP-dependent DNA ligase [Thiosocius teredinicola]|uniref:ATP-dependent DNA ligase n=1 Tax=Thiosocius teredinicola TaxID=1973002 RepID=UPI002FE4600C
MHSLLLEPAYNKPVAVEPAFLALISAQPDLTEPGNVLLNSVAQTSLALAATRSRIKKAALLVECLRGLGPEEIRIGVSYLSGHLPQGKIGLGYSLLQKSMSAPAGEATLSLAETDRRLTDIAGISGTGSQAKRSHLLGELLACATEQEQTFLQHLILGELRQGALEGLMIEAIAKASEQPLKAVRKAAMLSGDLPLVADRAMREGAAGLSQFRFEMFRPLQPMLAQPAEDPADALAQLGEGVFEYKLDGARVQVHKLGDDVRVFTRQLNEVTHSVPELVEQVRLLPAEQLVLDGEAIAFDKQGRPLPFQITMKRFGRRLKVDEMRDKLPLSARFFDCLFVDGDDLIDQSLTTRLGQLDDIVIPALRVPRVVAADQEATRDFLRQALQAGHEGIMAKAPDSLYEAGNRGANWLKIKPVHTLDLVVLAAEWGSGRRRGKLSNLHLGARDPRDNTFVMLGKTFKGLTDKMLEWQTDALLQREIGREGHIVHVRPELVVEVAFNELQASQQYPGGMALRFARVKRYRQDKTAADADTIDTVRAIFEQGFAGVSR